MSSFNDISSSLFLRWKKIVGGVTIDDLRTSGIPGRGPAIPTNVTATTFPTKIQLSWDDQSDAETGFTIYRSLLEDEAFVPLNTVGANVTSYNDSAASNGTTYYYRIVATNSTQESAPSKIVSAQINAFEFRVVTSNTGTSNNDQFTIPITEIGEYNCTINWGDGAEQRFYWDSENEALPDLTHTYSVASTYVIKITGTFKGFRFDDGGDAEKLVTILRWGAVDFNSNRAFFGCSNLTSISATDAPILSSPFMGSFFRDCTSLATFTGLDQWDMSIARSLENFFRAVPCVLDGIENWDVSNVTTLDNMFRDSAVFNADISGWDVSSVTDMNSAFRECSAFNQDIGSWDVSSVTDMLQMFRGATIFNQDLGSWDVGNVTRFNRMFQNTSFDQDIGSWDISSLTNAVDMFTNVALSTVNYNLLLTGWEATASGAGVVNVTFDGGNSTYTAGGPVETARTNLISGLNWTITDGGPV